MCWAPADAETGGAPASATRTLHDKGVNKWTRHRPECAECAQTELWAADAPGRGELPCACLSVLHLPRVAWAEKHMLYSTVQYCNKCR